MFRKSNTSSESDESQNQYSQEDLNKINIHLKEGIIPEPNIVYEFDSQFLDNLAENEEHKLGNNIIHKTSSKLNEVKDLMLD